MPFIITGRGPDGLRSVSRTTPASAIVLAMRWYEEGVQDIEITPPDQDARCFRVFQSQHYGALLAGSVRRRNPSHAR